MVRCLLSVTVSIVLVHSTAADTFAQLEDRGLPAGEPQAASDACVLNELFGEEYLAENVRCIRRAAAALDPVDRYEFLASWILPGPRHPEFRIAGEFTPTDPSPPAVRLGPERFPEGRGGGLASPVFDLLEASAEVGRLEELRARIAGAPEPLDEFQRRAKAALRLMVNLELGDDHAAAEASDKLHMLAVEASPRRIEDTWPETLALHRGFLKSQPIPALRDLLSSIYSERTTHSVPPGTEHWHARIVYLMERDRIPGNGLEEPDTAVPDDWVSVLRLSALARGDGYPHSLWGRNGSEIHHLRGHHEDYLFFRCPLRGDFEIAGEMGIDTNTQLFAAGKYFGPRWAREELEVGDFREGPVIKTITPPFHNFSPWIRFRAVVRDGVRTIHLNGRPVHTEELPEHHDPWFGVRAWSRNVARLRNVQVTGEPRIPDEVLMSASTGLVGWVPYSDESAGQEDSIWQLVGTSNRAGEIHGRRRDVPKGCFCESLLGYHRPLVEDGAIDYDFFYVPGRIDAHPALDRLAFLLDPRGVRIHWITDGKYDRTDVPPDNVFDEPHHRRGPAELPLRSGDWNHVRLSLNGDFVVLELNGEPVYQRELELTNRRTFGLFHYADRTELRVRDVVMRGAWPKRLPPQRELDLADPIVAALDADRPKLTSVFTHDFAADGLPEQYFQQMNWDSRARIAPHRDGIHVVRPGGEWTSVAIRLPFSAPGDFDFEASFDQLYLQNEQHACIMLQAAVNDERQQQCRLLRRSDDRESSHRIEAAVSLLHPDGERDFSGEAESCEALAGTLRLARRGDEVHYLFAEDGSRAFQLIGTRTVSDAPLIPEGVDLSVICNGAGEAGVVWKSVTLRAEQLKYLPPDTQPPQTALYVMNDDGSGLRELTLPPDGFTQLGSPEWSPDGRCIALDVSRRSTTTSHIFIVDVETGDATDLGPGCMPNFSRDGSRIAFSQSGQGVMMMDADGANRRVLDASGWGVQFSPDGQYIAYGKSGNITLRNVATGEDRELLRGQNATRYNYVYWNLGWSHDSRSIAFKARRRDTGEDELAVADVDSPDGFQVLYSTAGSLYVDFTFSPDNEQVLFSMHSPEHKSPRLFVCGRNEPGPPVLLPGQPLDIRIFDCAWSSDDRIAFAGQRIPQPVDWPPADELDLRPE